MSKLAKLMAKKGEKTIKDATPEDLEMIGKPIAEGDDILPRPKGRGFLTHTLLT